MPRRRRITFTPIGSTIGTHRRKCKEAWIRGLGPGRIGTSSTLEDTPAVWGMIGKVPELVQVDEYQPVETRSRRGKKRPARGRQTYIWEQDAWPDFTWDDDRLRPLSAEVTNARTALRKRFDSLDLDPGEQKEIADRISRLLDAPQDPAGVPEVMRESTDNCAAPLTKERLCDWHRQLFPDGIGDGREIVTGDWRRHRVEREDDERLRARTGRRLSGRRGQRRDGLVRRARQSRVPIHSVDGDTAL